MSLSGDTWLKKQQNMPARRAGEVKVIISTDRHSSRCRLNACVALTSESVNFFYGVKGEPYGE